MSVNHKLQAVIACTSKALNMTTVIYSNLQYFCGNNVNDGMTTVLLYFGPKSHQRTVFTGHLTQISDQKQ